MTPDEQLLELMSQGGVPESTFSALADSGVSESAALPAIERLLSLQKEEEDANALLQQSVLRESAQPPQMSTKELMSSAILSVLPLLAGGLFAGSAGVAGAAGGAQEGAKVYTAGRLQENKEARQLAISRSKILRDLVQEKSKQKGALAKELVTAPLDIEKRKAGASEVKVDVNTGEGTTLPVGGITEEFIKTLEPENQAAIRGAIAKNKDIGQKDLGDLLANDVTIKKMRGIQTVPPSDAIRKEAETLQFAGKQVDLLLEQHAAMVKSDPVSVFRSFKALVGDKLPSVSAVIFNSNAPHVYDKLRSNQAITMAKILYPGDRVTEPDAERAVGLIPQTADHPVVAVKKGEILHKIMDLKMEAFKAGLRFAGFRADAMFGEGAVLPFDVENPEQVSQLQMAVAGGRVGQVFTVISPSTGLIEFQLKTAETDPKTGKPVMQLLSSGNYDPGVIK